MITTVPLRIELHQPGLAAANTTCHGLPGQTSKVRSGIEKDFSVVIPERKVHLNARSRDRKT